uniref:AMP-binding enzyme domain protein n=1 Tax=Burkholderia orbicola (strain AU 1054) TaxID=331271 RepID=A0A0H2XS49_BURO1
MKPSVDARALHRLRAEQRREHRRREADEVAAPAAVQVDRRQFEDRRLDVDGHRLARAERRRAADEIARMAVRDLGLARLDTLRADLPREILRRHGAVAVHQHDQRLRVLVFHHERLHDAVLVDAELARRFAGAAVLDVFVRMLAECDAMTAQQLGRRGFGHVSGFAHGGILMANDRRARSGEPAPTVYSRPVFRRPTASPSRLHPSSLQTS